MPAVVVNSVNGNDANSPVSMTVHPINAGMTYEDMYNILLGDWRDKYYQWVGLLYGKTWVYGILVEDGEHRKRVLTTGWSSLHTYDFDPHTVEMRPVNPMGVRDNIPDGQKFCVLTTSDQCKECWFEGDRIKIQDGDIVVDITNAFRAYTVACKLEVS